VDASYWTLPVETTFYGAMMLVMALGAMKHLQKIIAVWVVLQALTCWFMWDVPLIGYAYYFLAAGSVMALLYQRRNERLNYALLALALVPCLRCVYEISRRADFNFWIGAAVIGIAFAGFLLMRGREFRLPGAQRIGSLTYPLYLLHFHIGLTMLGWWIDEANKWWVLPLVLGLLIAFAALLDDVIEFRMRPVWRRLFGATIARPVAWLESRTGSPSARLR
jgi:peptidoglycan/LPS O-acetylase OafA/YrhL